MNRRVTAILIALAVAGAMGTFLAVQVSSSAAASDRVEPRADEARNDERPAYVEPVAEAGVAPVARPSVARTAPPPVAAAAEPAAAEGVESNENAMPLPRPTVFPHSIDEVPMTAWRQEQLAMLDPQDVELLDYKLGVLGSMRDCFAQNHPELASEQGEINFFFHFGVDPQTGVAHGSTIDILDSEASEAVDAAFLACAAEAHAGREYPSDHLGEGQTEFHWATAVRFPLESDNAYLFFAR